MRRIYLLPLLLFLFLTACKDDKETTPSVNEQIKGVWVMGGSKNEYYNGSTLVYTTTDSGTGKITMSFDGKEVTLTIPISNSVLTSTEPYSISRRSGKDYLTIHSTPPLENTIISITPTKLVLQEDHLDVTYRENNQKKAAERLVITQEYLKQ